ncbi:hypothetical protein [Ascidiimonas aurantiaca]|uniref:hypothetical protein n=1 Tax=Ascidiimonas aurantiaca TaxID=1685432 RepID=UPI0030EB695C
MKKIILSFFVLFFALKSFSQEVENGPDFSDIDSIEKVIELYEKGELFKIYMMPLEFGGGDSAENTLYVPEFVQKFKKQYDKIVEDLLLDGKKLSFEATPEYKGRSFVPSKLKLVVTGDSEFTETIHIW